MHKTSLLKEASKSMVAAHATRDEIVKSLTNILDNKLKLLNTQFEQLYACETCDNLKQFKQFQNTCNGFEDLYRLQDKFIEDIFSDCSPASSLCLTKCSSELQDDKARPQERSVESLLPKLKFKKEFEAMFVHGGNGPTGFYARIVANASNYQKMEEEINHLSKLPSINFNDISFPFLAIVKSQQFDKLFRAFVLGERTENRYEVFYCDWGNKEIVPAKCILEAPAAFSKEPAAAIRMTLTNEQSEVMDWTAEAVQYFMDLVNKGPRLKVQVKTKVLLMNDDFAYAVVAFMQKEGEHFSLYDILQHHNKTRREPEKPRNEDSSSRPTIQSNVPLEDMTPVQCDIENLNSQIVDKLNSWFKKSDNNFSDPLLPPEDELLETPPSPTGTYLTSVSQRVPTFKFG